MASLKHYNETGEGHMYTRYENPTIQAAEKIVAALEGAQTARLFASGMAATSAIYLSLLRAGESVASMQSVYGGTFKLLARHLPAYGMRAIFLGMNDLAQFEEKLDGATRILHLETPTNPTLQIVDIEALARRAHARGLIVVVDNTFATPILQSPLALGADLVYHSATKYLSGHSDVTGGVVAGSETIMGPIDEARRVFGGTPDPFAAWLLLRGLKTLPVRVEAQTRGAAELAARLCGHARLSKVLFPGLPGHPGYDIAARQMRGPGAMLTLELREGLAAAERAMDRFSLILRAASLGCVESLASIPVHTSHAGYSPEDLARAGVSQGMIRLSVGLEDPEDLFADLEQAIA